MPEHEDESFRIAQSRIAQRKKQIALGWNTQGATKFLFHYYNGSLSMNKEVFRYFWPPDPTETSYSKRAFDRHLEIWRVTLHTADNWVLPRHCESTLAYQKTLAFIKTQQELCPEKKPKQDTTHEKSTTRTLTADHIAQRKQQVARGWITEGAIHFLFYYHTGQLSNRSDLSSFFPPDVSKPCYQHAFDHLINLWLETLKSTVDCYPPLPENYQHLPVYKQRVRPFLEEQKKRCSQSHLEKSIEKYMEQTFGASTSPLKINRERFFTPTSLPPPAMRQSMTLGNPS